MSTTIVDAEYRLHEALLKIERRARDVAKADDVVTVGRLRESLDELDELRARITREREAESEAHEDRLRPLRRGHE